MKIKKCFCCGECADIIDHIISYSFNHVGKRKERSSRGNKNNLVPYCRECNCLASNKVFYLPEIISLMCCKHFLVKL